MTDKIRLVEGDYGHDLIVTLTDESTGAVLDLSAGGITVTLFFRKAGAAALSGSVVGTFPNGGADGKVKFTWPQPSILTPGDYEGEVQVGTATKKQTVYEKLKFKVRTQVEV